MKTLVRFGAFVLNLTLVFGLASPSLGELLRQKNVVPDGERIAPGMAPMPKTLYTDGISYVAPEVLMGADGQRDMSVLHLRGGGTVEALLEQKPRKGCIRLERGFNEDMAPSAWKSLDSVLDSVEFVTLVEVTGLAPGFLHGVPGTLVRIRRSEDFKGQLDWTQRFLWMPVGTVELDGKVFCNTDSAWISIPQLGDRLLLLFADHWSNTDYEILMGCRAPNVIRLGDEQVELPPFLRDAEKAAATLAVEDFIDRVKHHLQRGVTYDG